MTVYALQFSVCREIGCPGRGHISRSGLFGVLLQLEGLGPAQSLHTTYVTPEIRSLTFTVLVNTLGLYDVNNPHRPCLSSNKPFSSKSN